MPLESNVNTLDDLNESWPVGTDPKSQGDDHIRNVKKAAKASDALRESEAQAAQDTADAALAVANSADTLAAQTDRWLAFARVFAAGGRQASRYVDNAVREATGTYLLTFTHAAFNTAAQAVVVTGESSIIPLTASVEPISPTQVRVFIFDTYQPAATLRDVDFAVVRYMTDV